MHTDRYGNKKWYNEEGKLHRDNYLPAVDCPGVYKRWYQNGKLHRDVDEPAIIWVTGTKIWYKNDKLHREVGPASESHDGTKVWFQNDKRHNLNGPVITWSSGIKAWFIEDKQYKEEEFKKVIKRRNELAYWVYQRWYSDFMRNPYTERGQKYIMKDYDRLMKEVLN